MILALPLLLALAAALAWARRRYAVVTVDGESMSPALRPGDVALVRRVRPSSVRRGQVVVFAERPPPEVAALVPRDRAWAVKRVAAVPGDRLPPGVPASPGQPGPAPSGALVPPAHLAVLGDNASRSHDSRHYGCLPYAQVRGVVVRELRKAGERR
ncbi:S26 family signal peptidase [Bailinhaonella thermotolerans]|uniref:Peptidase S26 domain-containing protein n=1 Tax=Bailinhaonella thermotolerans TaxID=1070861 RepID=A0A3A4AJ26_9ACTN|nr:S26 family signal peptidase [Bailinhaonella thermotolerans]RJL20820.1 hypothetical protein D5H75_38855 [Bailinhaonella thermotolerans]